MNPPERLIADYDAIAPFVEALFLYSSEGQNLSLRTFHEGPSKPPFIKSIKRVGRDLTPVIEAAVDAAQEAADSPDATVFCPPIAGFTNDAEPWRAREQDLTEAYALSVECDRRPAAARSRLESLLGTATVVVASGGEYQDPETGEIEPKLHLHWRLAEPATGAALAVLKEARRLATRLVGADASNVPMVHPIRWPGSWHRKGTPRLATIEALSQDSEIKLADALEALRAASPAPTADTGQVETVAPGERLDIAELVRGVTSGETFHANLVPLAARLIGNGLAERAAVDFLRGMMEALPEDSRDERWRARLDDIPRIVASAQAKFGARTDPDGIELAEPATLDGVVFDGEAPSEPPRELVKGLLPADGVAFIGGQSGAGKTFIAVDLAVALASAVVVS